MCILDFPKLKLLKRYYEKKGCGGDYAGGAVDEFRLELILSLWWK